MINLNYKAHFEKRKEKEMDTNGNIHDPDKNKIIEVEANTIFVFGQYMEF